MKRIKRNILKVFLVLVVLSIFTGGIFFYYTGRGAADAWVKSFEAIGELTKKNKTFIKGDQLEFFLSDVRGNVPFSTLTDFLIQDNRLYHGMFKEWRYRELKKFEIDSLNYFAHQVNLSNVDSSYYRHLYSTYYKFSLSMTDGNSGFSTAVNDTIVPKEIGDLYRYLKLISKREVLNQYEKTYLSFDNYSLGRLVDSFGDTIHPNNETYFRLNKTIIGTPKDKWTVRKSVNKPEFTVLLGLNKVENRKIETIGITKSDSLFFKLNGGKNYYFTKIDYGIKIYPLDDGPVDPDADAKNKRYRELLGLE